MMSLEICSCSAGMYFEAMASVHVCFSTADLAAFLFVPLSLSALIAFPGVKSSPVNKLLPCTQPCSLASFQVTTCTHFVHGNHYPYLHLHLALHCSTGALLHRSGGKLWKHNRSCCQHTYCAALHVCDLVYTWHHIAPRHYTRVLMPV